MYDEVGDFHSDARTHSSASIQVLQKQVEKWQAEQAARDRLMQEVLAVRKEQVLQRSMFEWTSAF